MHILLEISFILLASVIATVLSKKLEFQLLSANYS